MRKPRLGTVLLILWGLLLSLFVTVYLVYLQPARLGKTVSDTLAYTLGLPSSIHQVDFVFFPTPRVNIQGLQLRSGSIENLEFRVDSARAEFSWLSLLRGKPVLRALDLQGPVVDMIWPLVPIKAAVAPSPESAAALPVLPHAITGIRVRVENGSFRMRVTGTSHEIQLNDISGRARLPGLMSGNLNFDVPSCSLRLGRAPEITVTNFTLQAQTLHEARGEQVEGTLELAADLQMASLETTLGHPVKPEYQFFPLPEPARFEASMEIKADPAERQFALSGLTKTRLNMPMNGHLTPVAVDIPFSMTSLASVQVQGMEVHLDEDAGVFNGEVTGLLTREPVFTGHAEISHFSLTRWFGFGRKMTAGLQIALGDITGEMEFVLTPRGIHASYLRAFTKGITLIGTGSCEDFLNPNVLIAGHIENADINPLFPEINGIKTAKPTLPPPAVPLTENGSPSKVDFDIHLEADNVDVLKLSIRKVDCRITQLPPELRHGTGTGSGAMLEINVGDVYGGTAESFVYLEDKHRVVATLHDIPVEEPIRLMAGFSALGGLLQAKVDTTFFGDSPAAIMGNLSGKVDASLHKGFFGSQAGNKVPYQTLTVLADAKAAPPPGLTGDLPQAMDFNGSWKATLLTDDLTVTADSKSTLTFSMKNGLPMLMEPQATTFKVRLDKDGPGLGVWPQDITLDVKGRAAFDINAGTASLVNISGGRTGLVLGGTLRVDQLLSKPIVSGRVSTKTAVLRETAALFGLSLPAIADKSMLSLLILEADLSYDGSVLNLKNIVSTLDKTDMTGSLSVTPGARPFWQADLKLGLVNSDAYWPAPGTGTPTPLPTGVLLKHDGDFRLHCMQFTFFATPIVNLELPVTLKQGQLDSALFSASFPGGGSLTGTLHADTKPAPKDPAGRDLGAGQVAARMQLSLNDVDMLSLSESRGQETLMAGKGTAHFDVQAPLKTWDDIPAKLDGSWSFMIRDGYTVNALANAAIQPTPDAPRHTFGMASTDSSARPVSPRTNFSALSASGSILNGVLTSNDFLMKDTVMTIKGGGQVNLNTKTIDAKVTATLLGVPEMPVEISGSLSAPKTSYKIVGAVAGTIGNIGGTVVDIVGSVLTAPFRLFSGKR